MSQIGCGPSPMRAAGEEYIFTDTYTTLSISDDGEHVVLTPHIETPRSILHLTRGSDGSRLWEIDKRGYMVDGLALSPSGEKLAVLLTEMALTGRSELYILDVNTSALQLVPIDRYYLSAPCWTADGQSVVLFIRDRGSTFYTAHEVNPTTHVVRQISGTAFQSVSWAGRVGASLYCTGVRGRTPFEALELDERSNFLRLHSVGSGDQPTIPLSPILRDATFLSFQSGLPDGELLVSGVVDEEVRAMWAVGERGVREFDVQCVGEITRTVVAASSGTSCSLSFDLDAAASSGAGKLICLDGEVLIAEEVYRSAERQVTGA